MIFPFAFFRGGFVFTPGHLETSSAIHDHVFSSCSGMVSSWVTDIRVFEGKYLSCSFIGHFETAVFNPWHQFVVLNKFKK